MLSINILTLSFPTEYQKLYNYNNNRKIFDFCYSVTRSSPTLQFHGLQYTRLPCPSLSLRVCSDSCPLSQRCYLTVIGRKSTLTPYWKLFLWLPFIIIIVLSGLPAGPCLSVWLSNKVPLGGFPGGSANKESTCRAGELGSIPGLGRSAGEGKGYPPQYSGLENSMDGTVPGVAKIAKWTSDFHLKCIYLALKREFVPAHLWIDEINTPCRKAGHFFVGDVLQDWRPFHVTSTLSLPLNAAFWLQFHMASFSRIYIRTWHPEPNKMLTLRC